MQQDVSYRLLHIFLFISVYGTISRIAVTSSFWIERLGYFHTVILLGRSDANLERARLLLAGTKREFDAGDAKCFVGHTFEIAVMVVIPLQHRLVSNVPGGIILHLCRRCHGGLKTIDVNRLLGVSLVIEPHIVGTQHDEASCSFECPRIWVRSKRSQLLKSRQTIRSAPAIALSASSFCRLLLIISYHPGKK